jgi:hypothetical protein
MFMPIAFVLCYGVTAIYPKVFPEPRSIKHKALSLPELPPLPRLKSEADRPAPRVQVMMGLEKAKFAVLEGAYGLACREYKAEMAKMNARKLKKWTKRYADVEERHHDAVAMEVARTFIKEKHHFGARLALDEVINVRLFREEYMEMHKILDSHLLITDATADYLKGDFKSVLAQLEYLESEDADALRNRIHRVVDAENLAEQALERQDYDEAKQQYREVQGLLDDPSHGLHLDVESKLKQLSDNKWLASAYIESGDRQLIERRFDQAKVFYHKASKYDQTQAKTKLAYLEQLPKDLMAKAKKNEKSRPQMAYYALKEALSLIGDNPKLAKSINLKMKAIASRLKRYDMVMD